MNGEESAEWKMVETLANLRNGLGIYYFPQLHRIYKRLDDDPRTFFIVSGHALTNDRVGQFDLTELTADGKDFTEATIQLNFSVINNRRTTASVGILIPDFEKFQGLLGGDDAALRVAEIFGHEGGHGEWALDNIADAISLQVFVNDASKLNERRNKYFADRDALKKKDRKNFKYPPDLAQAEEAHQKLSRAGE